jgi:hypothetical protein
MLSHVAGALEQIVTDGFGVGATLAKRPSEQLSEAHVIGPRGKGLSLRVVRRERGTAGGAGMRTRHPPESGRCRELEQTFETTVASVD